MFNVSTYFWDVSNRDLLLLFTLTYKSILEPRFDPRVLFFVYFMCQVGINTVFSSAERSVSFSHQSIQENNTHI